MLSAQAIIVLFSGLGVLYLAKILLNGILSPVSKLPGPWYSSFTHLPLKYHLMSGRRMYFVDNLHKRYGPMVRIAPREVSVSDLESFSRIHKITGGFPKADWYETLTPDREPGIFVQRDPVKHGQRRRLFAKAFSKTSLRMNWDADIRQHVGFAVARIKEDALRGEADVLKWWTLMTTDVIAHLSFGESFHMLQLGKQTSYIDALQSIFLMSFLRAELPILHSLLRLIPHPSFKKLLSAQSIVQEHGDGAVRNMRNHAANVTQNLFGLMLATADAAEKADLTNESVALEASNLIIAGSDTTAVTLTYLVWAVLKRPALQRELEEEVAGLGEALELEELENRAPLMNAVIEETLRLYGAAPGGLPREVPAGGATLGGWFVPGGMTVSTQAYTIHRDERVFPDPLRFDPSRFLDKASLTPAQKTAMHPFGAGSRICLGLHLAWIEMRLGVAMFFRECRGARLAPGMTDDVMEMENRFLIAPKGHKCTITLG